MNLSLHLQDFAALSPLLILLIGALGLLLLESFLPIESKKRASLICFSFILFALFTAVFAPASQNSLLTPWLRFDSLSRFFTIFFLVIGLASVLLASAFFKRFDEHSRGEYYFLLLSSLFGLVLIGSSADFLTLFLGIETLSLSLYVLCGYMKGWRTSGEASLKYLLIGSFATAFFVYGIALVYGASGSTSFDALLPAYQSLESSSALALFLGGIALITLSLAFKAAIVPFHTWAPDVYEGASTPVTAFMAVGTKAGAFAALIRVFMDALPNFNIFWNQAIAMLVFPTLIYANLVALRQNQMRRFFAYSGISHAGFLLIPLVAGIDAGLPSMLFYLIVYAAATFGAFAVLASLDNRSEGVFLHDLHGLFKRAPFQAVILTLCVLTLAGIPPTAGFFAKLYIFKVAFQAGYHALVVVGLLTTIVAAFYYLRIISAMFAEDSEEKSVFHSWPAQILGTASCLSILAFSFYPKPILAFLIQLVL